MYLYRPTTEKQINMSDINGKWLRNGRSVMHYLYVWKSFNNRSLVVMINVVGYHNAVKTNLFALFVGWEE